jgi:hypothetical protein
MAGYRERLERLLAPFFGPALSKGQLYGGFYLMTGGVVLGFAALILFLISNSQTGVAVYNWREGAFVLGALAVPSIFLGVAVALPTKMAMRAGAALGLVLCAIAALLFSIHYPLHFNVPDSGQADHTALDVGLYSFGLVLLLASTFTSLIGYYTARPVSPSANADGEVGALPAGYDVPDWVVEKDIDFAMKKYGVSWGESPQARRAQGLQINVDDDLGPNVVIGGRKAARTVQLETPGLDDATKKLSTMRPNKKKVLDQDWGDDSMNALLNFRKAKAANPKEFAPRASFWSRLFRRGPHPQGSNGHSKRPVDPQSVSASTSNTKSKPKE